MSSSTDMDKKSNVHMYITYTLFLLLTIGLGYVIYKQTTSDTTNQNSFDAAARAAVVAATENAGYETQSDLTSKLNTLTTNLNSLITAGPTTNAVTIPATNGLFSYMPAYGYFYSNNNTNNTVQWNNTIVSNNVTVSGGTVKLGLIGLYELSLSGQLCIAGTGGNWNWTGLVGTNIAPGYGTLYGSDNQFITVS